MDSIIFFNSTILHRSKEGNLDNKKKRSSIRTSLAGRLTALVLAAAITLIGIVPGTAAPAEAATIYKWGVFIGTKVTSTAKVKNYQKIVIDAQNYSAAEIKRLKSGGRKVYSYLSIGSIATYRSYYNRFKKYSLGKYTNWSAERWIDTSKVAWQDFCVNELAKSFKRKGVDGLWVDNTDVWYEYHRAPIFNGLVYILRRCKKLGFAIIINGGDVFVSHLLKSGKGACINGVMQEEVITRISDYNGNHFAMQTSADRKYYEAYLKVVKRYNKSIALLEYCKTTKTRNNIIAYCKKHGYSYYISNNVALK